MTDTANAPERAFEFNTQGKAPSQKTKRIPPGLYTVSWKDGGTSEVAIGMTSNGDNWMAPTNWLRPAMIHSVEGDVWGSFERLERINATHCDELVAAAYLDAGWRIEQCLWSYHWYIDGESVDPEDLSEDITKRTPDDARAALTAYGERMKAEGACEAQLRRLGPIAELLPDAVRAAEKAMVRYPQPNYVISKWAEETGEVTKDLIHVAEGRQTFEKLRGEIVQSLAMLHRLLVEGDQIHGLPPIAPALQENANG